MRRFFAWLDRLSLPLVAVLAVMLGAAPWPAGPEPHLVEKIGMLVGGTLRRPIDVFDLIMHGAPLLLLVAKAARVASRREDDQAGI